MGIREEPVMRYTARWKIWISIVWICTLAEGLWLIVVGSFVLASPPLSFCLLLGLWLAILIGLLSFNRRPNVLLLGSLANLVGCFLIKGIAGGWPTSMWSVLYEHSLDVFIFLFSYLAFRDLRKGFETEWANTSVPF